MYNRKSKVSAIFAIMTAVLLIGFMVLLPFLRYDTEEGNGFAAFFIYYFSMFGYPTIYASSISFVIVALIFGIKMLKQQSRQKLISFNVRMLITTCILLPFLAAGLTASFGLIFQSELKLFPTICTIVVSVAYVVCLITQIVTIVVLKKSPEEIEPTLSEL